MMQFRASGGVRWPRLSLLILACCLCAYASITTGGRGDVGFWDLFARDTLAASVMWDIRLPRTVVAMCIGVNLGLAGLILQAVTRNPLASPAILGVNQGAALGLVFGLVFAPVSNALGLQTLAIVGAFTAGFITFAIAGGLGGRLDGLRLVLGGVAVGAFAYAMVRFTFTLEDDLSRQVLRWTVGSITDVRWDDVKLIVVWAGGGLIATAFIAQRLNLMALGEASSAGLGADPRMTLLMGAFVAAVLTGTSVAVAGPIAFVGLVVPHVCRMLIGPDHRRLVFVVPIIGATLMMAADGVSKWLTAPIEIPVGVVVALIGAPFFLCQALFADDIE
ncbi:iron ABC transporter permease [Thalassobium sp. R2A62]|uniref:FecCD family ABC transporter permease n=1 Tax=Thalassobium sp. R2A62 TaxID=633131 RepID=UPI0001B1CECF|nr:iron(III) dicitrate transport system permease protein FecC [Thalassobium sp. R2A62]